MLAGLDERLAVVLVGLGLSLVLLVLARASRKGRPGSQQLISLGAGHRLHVVEFEGRRLLIGTGPNGSPQLLTELASSPSWSPRAAQEESVRAA